MAAAASIDAVRAQSHPALAVAGVEPVAIPAGGSRGNPLARGTSACGDDEAVTVFVPTSRVPPAVVRRALARMHDPGAVLRCRIGAGHAGAHPLAALADQDGRRIVLADHGSLGLRA